MSKRLFLIWTKPTVDGLAFYPHGSWGRGVIIDAQAERRLRVYFSWQSWIVVVLVMVSVPDFVPGARALKVLVCLSALYGMQWVVFRSILRGGRHTDIRLTAAEIMQRKAEVFRGDLLWRGLLLVPFVALTIGVGFFLPPVTMDRQIFGALGLAIWAYIFVEFVRLGRAIARLPT